MQNFYVVEDESAICCCILRIWAPFSVLGADVESDIGVTGSCGQ